MKDLFHYIFLQNSFLKELGLTIIRIGIGLIYIRHGYPKLLSYDELVWHGEKMANLGITFAPVFWGLAAALSEFFGGIALTLGFCTRIAAPFMAFTMFVAVIYHLKKGDPWGYLSYPLAMMIIFIGVMFTGSGTYSLDYWLKQRFFF